MIYVTVIGLAMLATSMGMMLYYKNRETPAIADYLGGLAVILILAGLFAGNIV